MSPPPSSVRWLPYCAAVGLAALLLAAGVAFDIKALAVPALTLTFPAFWLAHEMAFAAWRASLHPDHFKGVFLLPFAFLYLFGVFLPTRFRRSVCRLPWWVVQVLALLPGLLWGLCFWAQVMANFPVPSD